MIGQEVARALDVPALFAERADGALTLRRGFSIDPADRVLVVEDVVTTGGSTRETMAVARAAGATVVGACAIVDRSGGNPGLDVPVSGAPPHDRADLRSRTPARFARRAWHSSSQARAREPRPAP